MPPSWTCCSILQILWSAWSSRCHCSPFLNGFFHTKLLGFTSSRNYSDLPSSSWQHWLPWLLLPDNVPRLCWPCYIPPALPMLLHFWCSYEPVGCAPPAREFSLEYLSYFHHSQKYNSRHYVKLSRMAVVPANSRGLFPDPTRKWRKVGIQSTVIIEKGASDTNLIEVESCRFWSRNLDQVTINKCMCCWPVFRISRTHGLARLLSNQVLALPKPDNWCAADLIQCITQLALHTAWIAPPCPKYQ